MTTEIKMHCLKKKFQLRPKAGSINATNVLVCVICDTNTTSVFAASNMDVFVAFNVRANSCIRGNKF